MSGTHQLMAKLLYGGGLRLMECIRLRNHDLDFERNLVYVRGAKGGKDRTTFFPASLKDPLQQHLRRVKQLHEQDLNNG
jgi:integrase